MIAVMKNIGIIDIGSNSIRLMLVQININNSFSVIDEIKETIRLGKDMSPDGKLHTYRIEKAMETLSFFKHLCKAQDVKEIFAVATEAVRKASNKSAFLNKIKTELNLTVRVLSGNEEAYYSYFGTINSIDIDNALLVDIGGSSTELILVENRKVKASISLPLGGINLTEKFSLTRAMDTETEKELKTFLQSFYKNIPWLLDIKDIPLVGIGGTIRNIAKINRKSNSYPLDNIHNYRISTSDVVDIYKTVSKKDASQRKKIKGLSKDRADIFLGPITSVVTLLEFCSINELLISGNGLREGLLYEYILGEKSAPVEDVLNFSLNNLLLNYEINEAHTYQVWKLSEMLYNNLKLVEYFPHECYKILKTASLLHDCGVRISYYDHHEHSFYMILNSKINGLSHKEQLMSAYVAALHRKNDFKINLEKYSSILTEIEVITIQKLGVLLRLSESLDRAMDGNVEQINFSAEEDAVVLDIKAKNNPILEIASALEAVPAFEKLYGKKLIIQSSC
jgi:exopolyphosphatase/guanosine-5'-triphosphate,3'-diphosphate pyrophosphatase